MSKIICQHSALHLSSFPGVVFFFFFNITSKGCLQQLTRHLLIIGKQTKEVWVIISLRKLPLSLPAPPYLHKRNKNFKSGIRQWNTLLYTEYKTARWKANTSSFKIRIQTKKKTNRHDDHDKNADEKCFGHWHFLITQSIKYGKCICTRKKLILCSLSLRTFP